MAETHSAISWEQRHMHVLHAFSRVEAIASKLILILVQPELDCERLHELGFLAVKTGSQMKECFAATGDCPPNVGAFLIVHYGTDFHDALEFCSSLDQSANSPPRIVVLILPGDEFSESGQQLAAGGEQELSISKAFFNTKIDDVMAIHGMETLNSLRVQEAILRTVVMAGKAAAMISHEVAAAKKRSAARLQSSWNVAMWELPGKVLESIPPLDDSLKARSGDSAGMGGYRFVSHLGSGSFGAVFEAEHPTLGVRALKVIAKSSVQKVCQLISIDSELCIMTHLPAHPNIARAHGAFHDENNITLVMDYCGGVNLHIFVVQQMKHMAEAALPADTVLNFCRQLASGVHHLHSHMVCHRDLKPTNFVLSSDGSTLRIIDFGLAVMTCGPDQRLLHCGGSLPFASPEVLRLQGEPRPNAMGSSAGYAGFPADIWCLAVNFIELAYGLYSMERFLRWVPKPPPETHQRLLDIKRFSENYCRSEDHRAPFVKKVAKMMFPFQPEERWTIAQVAGPEGLAIDGIPERHEPRCLPNVRARTHFASEGIDVRELPPSTSPSIRVEDVLF